MSKKMRSLNYLEGMKTIRDILGDSHVDKAIKEVPNHLKSDVRFKFVLKINLIGNFCPYVPI